MNLNFRAELMLAVLSVFILSVPRLACAATPTDPCSLLTQAQVSAILGVNVDPAKRLAPTMCGWSAPNQPNSVNAKKIALLVTDARAFTYAKTPIIDGETAVPADGICNDAVYSFRIETKSGSETSLFVKKGAFYFTIHVYGFHDQAKAMPMEKALALNACTKL